MVSNIKRGRIISCLEIVIEYTCSRIQSICEHNQIKINPLRKLSRGELGVGVGVGIGVEVQTDPQGFSDSIIVKLYKKILKQN